MAWVPLGGQGAVLLDAAWQPRTMWQFEAVVVLLSGTWPPRGLLSGPCPPAPRHHTFRGALSPVQHACF